MVVRNFFLADGVSMRFTGFYSTWRLNKKVFSSSFGMSKYSNIFFFQPQTFVPCSGTLVRYVHCIFGSTGFHGTPFQSSWLYYWTLSLRLGMLDHSGVHGYPSFNILFHPVFVKKISWDVERAPIKLAALFCRLKHFYFLLVVYHYSTCHEFF